jgi:hypothetical protein
MALNVLCLKNAIQKVLEGNQCLVDWTCHGEVDIRLGEPRISIAERGPDTLGQLPYIGIEIADTVSLTPDHPISGCYNSLIFIFVVGRSQKETNIIADEVHSMFTSKPIDSSQKWFLDFSDDCIINKFTKFVSRLRFGREGINKFDPDVESWVEAIEARVIWCDCPCSGMRCEDEPEVCPIETPDLDDELDCDC